MTNLDQELPLATEQVPAGEEAAIAKVVEIELQLLQRRMDREELPSPGKPVPRGQHPKQHGCLRADFIVADNLPAELRLGVFAEPRKNFPAWLRFSNARSQDDRQADGHGLAVKLLNVPGEKLLESEKHEQTQDFVLLDSPVFFIKDALEFAEFDTALLQMSTAESWFSLSNLSLAGYFLTHPRELLLVGKIATSRLTNPLEAAYWSATPYKLGDFAVKYLVRPQAIVPLVIPPATSADQFREAMQLRLQNPPGAAFDFFVQPQTHPVRNPIEDATIEWDEHAAPYYKVATLQIPPQNFDTPERNAFGENLSFNPWHALPTHQPLGGINRLRKAVYQALSSFRHERNTVPLREPSPETSPS